VFDIETVKKANQTLIATIEDSLRIADEGRRRRRKRLRNWKPAKLNCAKRWPPPTPEPANRPEVAEPWDFGTSCWVNSSMSFSGPTIQ
jgi:hypothetical protein